LANVYHSKKVAYKVLQLKALNVLPDILPDSDT